MSKCSKMQSCARDRVGKGLVLGFLTGVTAVLLATGTAFGQFGGSINGTVEALATGTANETVTVDADQVPVMQTSDASIGNTITAETIQRLPTNGGDPYELLRTAPGITGDSARSGSGTSVFLPNGAGPGQSNSGIFQTENQVQISAAGQQVGANNYMIDGVSVDSLGQAAAAVVTPNQQSVAQITVLSKSGTNEIHGSLYFRYDDPGLNAGSLPQMRADR